MSKTMELLDVIEGIKEKITDMEYKSIVDLLMELNKKERLLVDIESEEISEELVTYILSRTFINFLENNSSNDEEFYLVNNSVSSIDESENTIIQFRECIMCRRQLEWNEENFRKKRNNTYNKTCSECLDSRNERLRNRRN
jgi:hypothetical protein